MDASRSSGLGLVRRGDFGLLDEALLRPRLLAGIVVVAVVGLSLNLFIPIRATLDPYLNQGDALLLIEHERQVELFTEWGHRWLDLKRTKRASTILGDQPNWQSTDSLYPIPTIQINTDPNMINAQNPGY